MEWNGMEYEMKMWDDKDGKKMVRHQWREGVCVCVWARRGEG